jgi:RNA polymerase sigma-70 factor, ECF subfamily
MTPRHIPVQAKPVDSLVDLAELAATGDRDAYSRLYGSYVDMVFRYIYFRVKRHALAEDLTSEVFVRALQRIHTFRDQGRDPGAWFVTIARNLVADYFKSGYNRLEWSGAMPWDQAPDRPDPDPTPDQRAADSHVARLLWKAVRALPRPQRDVMVLRYAHGLSIAETAAGLGKNEGAVKALAYRATRNLRTQLEAVGVLDYA